MLLIGSGSKKKPEIYEKPELYLKNVFDLQILALYN